MEMEMEMKAEESPVRQDLTKHAMDEGDMENK